MAKSLLSIMSRDERLRVLGRRLGAAASGAEDDEREALATLGRSGELADRWARYRRDRTDWTDADHELRRLFTIELCARWGIVPLPGDEHELRA
jgi:hypothetical protein